MATQNGINNKAYVFNSDTTITAATTCYATTFDTNVVDAGVTLAATTLSADGNDANININITAKGTGQVIIDDLQLTTDLAVSEGGTGVSTLTDHGVLIGNAASAITATAEGATGTVLIGTTANPPSWSASPTVTTMNATTFDTNVAAAAVTLSGTTLSADGTNADISINITAKGTGSVIIDELTLTTDLAVTEGGTGVSTFTDHGLLVGSGAGAVTALGVGGAGVILTGVAGDDPAWTTATYPATVATGDILSATNINVIGVIAGTTAAAGYVLMGNGSGVAPTWQAHAGYIAWSTETGATIAMLANNGYVCNRGTLITATLPATCAVNTIMRMVGKGAGGWLIAQNASQMIYYGDVVTATGVGGSLASSHARDCVELICTVADLEFQVISSIGNLTYVP